MVCFICIPTVWISYVWACMHGKYVCVCLQWLIPLYKSTYIPKRFRAGLRANIGTSVKRYFLFAGALEQRCVSVGETGPDAFHLHLTARGQGVGRVRVEQYALAVQERVLRGLDLTGCNEGWAWCRRCGTNTWLWWLPYNCISNSKRFFFSHQETINSLLLWYGDT